MSDRCRLQKELGLQVRRDLSAAMTMESERPVMATLRCTSQFEYPSYVFDTSQKILCVTSVRAQAQELTRVPIDVCAVIDRYALFTLCLAARGCWRAMLEKAALRPIGLEVWLVTS